MRCSCFLGCGAAWAWPHSRPGTPGSTSAVVRGRSAWPLWNRQDTPGERGVVCTHLRMREPDTVSLRVGPSERVQSPRGAQLLPGKMMKFNAVFLAVGLGMAFAVGAFTCPTPDLPGNGSAAPEIEASTCVQPHRRQSRPGEFAWAGDPARVLGHLVRPVQGVLAPPAGAAGRIRIERPGRVGCQR